MSRSCRSAGSFGPEYVSFLPAIIGLNVLVLGPVALACVYAIAARIGGRLLGLYAAAFWVAAPFLAIPFFRRRLPRSVRRAVPAPGARADGDGRLSLDGLPARRRLAACARARRRRLDVGRAGRPGRRSRRDDQAANLLFLAGPALLLLLARRWRTVLPYAAGAVPPLLLLALWKQRGLGTVPALALEQTRIAAGALVSADVLDKYVYLDWDTFRHNMASLREYAYSVRVLQWIPIAGAFAVARRSLPLGGLLAGWFGAFLLVKGTAPQATVDSGSLFRLLMPAFPAYFLLFASLPLLLPGVLRRIKPCALPPSPRPIARRTLVIVGVLFVARAARRDRGAAADRRRQDRRRSRSTRSSTPVDKAIHVTITPAGARRTVTWTHPDFGPTEVFYRVYRTEFEGADVECNTTRSPECVLKMIELETTRDGPIRRPLAPRGRALPNRRSRPTGRTTPPAAT